MSDQLLSNQLLGKKEDHDIEDTHDIIDSSATQSCTTSSPINVNRQRRRYTIPPEEYSIIEDPNDWNPNEAFNESIQLDESIDAVSSLSSSSSSSISYLLEMAQQMIANYPTEEQMAGMIAENYLNYIAEVLHQESPSSPQTNVQAEASISYIMHESTSDQANFSFEQENIDPEDMQHE